MHTDYTEADCIRDTVQHIHRVQSMIGLIVGHLCDRARDHDRSKLAPPEVDTFTRMTPLLKGVTYGGPAYRAMLDEMRPALEHHYKKNAHHPEHHKMGINDMTLIDVCEMFCDWIAAAERHADGDVFQSLRVNRSRFGISDQLFGIFENTAIQVFEKRRQPPCHPSPPDPGKPSTASPTDARSPRPRALCGSSAPEASSSTKKQAPF